VAVTLKELLNLIAGLGKAIRKDAKYLYALPIENELPNGVVLAGNSNPLSLVLAVAASNIPNASLTAIMTDADPFLLQVACSLRLEEYFRPQIADFRAMRAILAEKVSNAHIRFDYVVLCGFQRAPEIAALIGDMTNLLKPGGIIAIHLPRTDFAAISRLSTNSDNKSRFNNTNGAILFTNPDFVDYRLRGNCCFATRTLTDRSNDPWNQVRQERLLQRIVFRANHDPEFRIALTDNSDAVIRKIANGVKCPQVRWKFLDGNYDAPHPTFTSNGTTLVFLEKPEWEIQTSELELEAMLNRALGKAYRPVHNDRN
jgi:hypothetical protein